MTMTRYTFQGGVLTAKNNFQVAASPRRTCSSCGVEIRSETDRKCDGCKRTARELAAFCKQDMLGKPLSFRQRQIVQCIAEGLSNKDIAARLALRPAVVKVYISRDIFPKLGCNSRLQVARWWDRNGTPA